MKQVLYVSGATPEISDADLDAILASSRRNNERDGITGMLLWADGSFIQILEGEEPALEATLKRIRNDSRHRNIMVLVDHGAPGRAFGDWSMGFKRLDRHRETDRLLFETSRAAIEHRMPNGDRSLLLDIILAFSRDFLAEGRAGESRRRV
ncbi:FAD-dependent sensor of blue light [Hoeflea marina]|uniref:FAD-dependent sensor of blue light n=1 Tax=Hoeflea marina TaxID=274592 RepID=A0A317PNL5_9HYPH|nr:BLUF domain-containing protein [Hoeflea marina]PWW01819.1 FAD-dependent sensor of blue light [Hoeflea marina]